MYQSFVSSKFFYTFARMKRLTIITLALLSLNIMTAAKTNKTVTLRIIETSDVHGAFFPYDFIERRPMNGTMARVSTYLKRQRLPEAPAPEIRQQAYPPGQRRHPSRTAYLLLQQLRQDRLAQRRC